MMSQGRTFIVMLLLTVIASGLAGWGGVEYGLHRSVASTDLDVVLHRDLDLSSEQERKMEALEADFSKDRRSLQTEMRAANRNLARVIVDEHVYGPNASRAIERFHTAMASLQEKTVRHILEMRAVLSPSQAKRFDETIEKSLSTDAP
jgi:Heavy-metal resistance